jgi:multicomponent Na+:H+ antiporter subunit D
MNLVIAPILLPLFTGLISLAWGRSTWRQRVFIGIMGGVQLAVSIWFVVLTADREILVLASGGWAAPYGILLVVDLFTAIMLTLAALTAFATILYGFAEGSIRLEHPLRLPLVQFLVAGINLSFCTGDLFNLFVGFEVMLISSYALLTLEADDWDIKHAYPYFVINLFGSTLFICAAALTYSLFGTLNFADIAARAGDLGDDPRITALILLLVTVFGIKAGLFPLYYWLPNSYPTLPIPLSALYAGMLTKVGIYVNIRILCTVFPHEYSGIYTLIAWLAGATMIFGVLGAISRNFIRGILSFHILSQVGFMMLALGFFTPFSIAAAIFYIVHHIIVKSSLFLVGGAAAFLHKTDDLNRMGNLWKLTPWLGAIFLVQALSLAGLPPLSGFWGKYMIVVEGMKQGQYVLVGASIVASILTLFSMLKIWNEAFWVNAPERKLDLEDSRWPKMALVAGGMALISLTIGLGAEFFLELSQKAADSVLDRGAYIAAVFESTGSMVLERK